MNFDFEPQHYEFRDVFRDFLAKRSAAGKLAQPGEASAFDAALWREMAELGLFRLLVPERYDGLGLGFVDLALILEELGAALVPAPAAETVIATDLLVRHGSEAQRQRFLPGIGTGELRVSLAATEPESGFEPEAITTRATPWRDHWKLNGRKILVPEGQTAGLLLVTARLAEEGATGVVLLEPSAQGVELDTHHSLDPTSRYHRLDLRDVTVTREQWLGGGSPAAVGRLFDVAAAAAALQMIGIAARTLEISVAYARTREQFGRPIGAFQAIKHRLADMAVQTDAGRSAAYFAVWAVDEDAPERPRAVSIAKSFCGDASRFVCNEAIQIHGGMGFTWDLGLHFYLRRAKVLEYSWGDASMHRERLLVDTLEAL